MIFVENNSFDMIFMIVFFIIAGTFLFMIVNGISKWHRNNQSPRKPKLYLNAWMFLVTYMEII